MQGEARHGAQLGLPVASLATVFLLAIVPGTVTAGAGEPEPPAAAAAAEESEPAPAARPVLRAGSLGPEFTLGGGPRASAWADAPDSVAQLTTIEPREGEVPAARTVVKVLANTEELVVGVWCYDPDPSGIVATSKSRDAVLDEEDHLLIVLDTFLDGRSGYVFAVNPAGARFDGLVAAQGEEVNSDWDAIWECRTLRDSTGWGAEIRIPAKSLVFKNGLTTWGFNVQRRVTRTQETSRWAGASRDYEVYQTSRAGLLQDLPHFDLGQGLSVRPAGVGRSIRTSPAEPVGYQQALSLDVTKTLGPNLLSSLTVNTDFAETEVETRQINLTRFPLFFPEKRSFFLAGADIFEFGLGLDEENLIPFFSRRIGLFGVSEEDQAAVPIDAGGKVSGRIGNTNLGALVVGTRQIKNLTLVEDDLTLSIPRATMGALRVKQNIFEESSAGLLATFGDQRGRARSWSAGADFTYQTSKFMDDKNLLAGIWGMRTGREDLTGDRSAFGFSVDYPNDEVDVNLTSTRIGGGFDPSLSFVPRRGVHIWDFSAIFSTRPAWPGVRTLTQEIGLKLYDTPNNGTWTSYTLAAVPLGILFRSGDRIELAVEPQGDRPPESFSISDAVSLPAGSYEWTRYRLGATTAEKRRLKGELSWESGRYYDGRLTTVTASVTARPWSFLTLGISGERSTGTVTGLVDEEASEALAPRSIREELAGVRLALNVSPDLQLSSVTQYDTESHALGSNNRLRWTFAPQGDLFVVFDHNLQRTPNHRWHFLSSQLPVKLQYSWRF